MDPQLVLLIGILVGPAGIGGVVAVVFDRRRRVAAAAPDPPPPPGETQRRTADALDAVLDELVDARKEVRDYRQSIWRCPVEHCPVRDHLRGES